MILIMENLPLLGMGTWGMGGTFERDESADKESVAALRYGLDLGITLIDTAEFYGAGHAEEIVGEAMAGRKRAEIYIISKVWKSNLHYDDVLAAAKRSLERLDTGYIDLYLVHWPNPEIPLEETMRAMEKLVDEKLVRAVGVSNFSVKLMEEASSYLEHTRLKAIQIEYNLKHRDAEQLIIPYAQSHDINIIAYRPYAKGNLTHAHGKILSGLARKYNKTENQIALNWLIAQGVTAIPKATSALHIKENIGALGWCLSGEDIVLLRDAKL